MKSRKFPHSGFKILLLFGLFLSFAAFDGPRKLVNTMEYKIHSESRLEVNGKTNINRFSCSSKELFPKERLSYQVVAGDPTIFFSDAQLSIQIEQLDCGAKPINKDMHQALQAQDYPLITIDLKKATLLHGSNLFDCDEWVDFEAVSDITLVCTTKALYFPIQVKKSAENRIMIRGGAFLHLCDFGIKAPTALSGLIKVKDEIEINFNLIVDLLIE